MSVLAAEAVKDVVPVTTSVPVCESGPPVVRARVPVTVEALSTRALVSVSDTLFPLVMPTLLKSLPALVRVMSFATPAASVVVPVTVAAPLWVRAPLVVTLRLPLTVEVPNTRALASVSDTLFPLVIPTVLKLLPALVNVMSFAAPAASVVVPVTVTAPLWVMAPPVVTSKSARDSRGTENESGGIVVLDVAGRVGGEARHIIRAVRQLV